MKERILLHRRIRKSTNLFRWEMLYKAEQVCPYPATLVKGTQGKSLTVAL